MFKVFISSNQSEFEEERKFLFEEISKDPYLNRNVELFVFEADISRALPANEVFINQVEESDIYIGLIGSDYGDIYECNVSATEYEYNTFIADKHEAYFFIKDCDSRDEGSERFLRRIQKVNKYKTFKSKEELLDEVKKSLQESIDKKLTTVPFDNEILYNSSMEDVDCEAIELYLDALENDKIRDLFGKRDLDKILEYIGAGKIDKNGNFHFNKAGALFFAKDISKFDLGHEVKMVRFNGYDAFDVIDKLFSNESFFKLIKEFDNFFNRNTKLGGTVKGWKRIPIPEYPIEAVREAFINAIAHRDYTLAGGCITFYIYDDRIEIVSPGKLPFPLTVETLGIDIVPRHRNRNICKIFEKTKYMEHIGTGITRMRREMDGFNLPEPEFINDFYFKVILRGPDGKLILPKNILEYVNLNDFGLNDRQMAALEKMNNDQVEFTYNGYCEMFDVSVTTSKRDLNDLADKDLIHKKKIKNVNHYTL